jgi:hypothetical protein
MTQHSPRQHAKLAILALAEQHGLVNYPIAFAGMVAPGSIHLTFQRLERAGYLKRLPDPPRPPKLHTYALTEAGRLLVASERARLAGE